MLFFNVREEVIGLMNGKQFAVAALFAICLLTSIFIPIAHQQGGGTYDPWLDYNEDGRIDVADLQPLGQTYGTLGDPTKNVTMAKHTSKVIKIAESVSVSPYDIWASDSITIDGYAKVTVLIHLNTSLNEYHLVCRDYAGGRWYVDQAVEFNYYLVRTYDVMNQQIEIMVYNLDPFSAWVDVSVYLMA
jgi:hypothetical protein